MGPVPVPGGSFTITANRVVRILQSPVFIHTPLSPQGGVADPTRLGAKEYSAIWDTGATNTVITRKVVDELGLKPIGIAQVSTAGGIRQCEVYLVSVFLPNRVVIAILRVTEGNITGSDVLIGMDVISNGDFAVTNYQGKTTFSFRIPSQTTIDFVAPHQASSRKIGRNDPCPCGSRKKYKKCCGQGK